MSFKVGDLVERVENFYSTGPQPGEVHEVIAVSNDDTEIALKGFHTTNNGGWVAEHFRLVESSVPALNPSDAIQCWVITASQVNQERLTQKMEWWSSRQNRWVSIHGGWIDDGFLYLVRLKPTPSSAEDLISDALHASGLGENKAIWVAGIADALRTGGLLKDGA